MNSQALLYENDKEIIEEFLNSSSDRAANAFVRNHQKFVYATALRYLGNHDDAEDAAQEVFIKALNSLSSFRGESNVKTWLYRITFNICSNMLRKKKLSKFFSFGNNEEEYHNIKNSDYSAQEQLENKEFEEKFKHILQKLPTKQRETFALRYFEEMSYEEISKLLDTSVGGLKSNYFQAVQKLAKFLKPQEVGES